MNIRMGEAELALGGKYLTEMRDANDIIGDEAALQARMAEDGYLLIRGFHDREDVLQARREMLALMQEQGRLAPDAPTEEGRIGAEGKGFMVHKQDIARLPGLLHVVNHPRAMGFFDRFLGGPSLTYDYKWIRGVGQGGSTGAHYDVVYMGRGTKQVYTTWTPIGDISYDMGGLAVCLGSQHFAKIKATYGQMDVDRDNVSGWFSDNPQEIVDKYGGRWATTEFRAGDALIFGMFMMHGSLTNTTDRYRLSCDTRYQLASEPVDERWIGDVKGHYAWGKSPTISMADARAGWGV
ncbi:MAG: phytanoyl-CoA dioxygenase family protein [Paenibacillaceae bacterium]|nr:phytanoyl-CoA dioxygenase family protein [Paenibacillaceae bacterium]